MLEAHGATERDDTPVERHHAGFEVVLRSGHAGSMRLVPGASRVGLVVGHGGGLGSPVADDQAVRVPAASTTVWAHDDGRVLVRSTFAPPALLIGAPDRPVRLVPRDPGHPETVVLAPGERLVVLTAAAFDQAPQVIARLVRDEDEQPDDLRTTGGSTLLRRLLRHAPLAGGAVLTRTG